MDIDYIKSVLEDITNAVDDDKAQHMLEDDLLWTFVTFIAKKDKINVDLKAMAAEILKSRDIDFNRWCA